MIQTIPLPSHALRQQVARLAPWTEDAQWSALFGGRTNAAWRVTQEDKSLVLKLYRRNSANPLFPNDAKAEALMLRHLSGLGIAPELVAHFESDEGVCTLYHAIPGQPWRHGVTQVAELMRKLQAQPVPEGLRRVPNGSEEILVQADAILGQCDAPERLISLRPVLEVAPSAKDVLLHCDMVPGNLITNEDGLHVIDWQCPGLGDACEDIAMFLSPAMQLLYRGSALSVQETRDFLACLPDLALRYHALAPAYHYRMAAYCAWKVEQGVPDYAAGFAAEVAALTACLSTG